jgi:hypothetical protein
MSERFVVGDMVQLDRNAPAHLKAQFEKAGIVTDAPQNEDYVIVDFDTRDGPLPFGLKFLRKVPDDQRAVREPPAMTAPSPAAGTRSDGLKRGDRVFVTRKAPSHLRECMGAVGQVARVLDDEFADHVIVKLDEFAEPVLFNRCVLTKFGKAVAFDV